MYWKNTIHLHTHYLRRDKTTQYYENAIFAKLKFKLFSLFKTLIFDGELIHSFTDFAHKKTSKLYLIDKYILLKKNNKEKYTILNFC